MAVDPSAMVVNWASDTPQSIVNSYTQAASPADVQAVQNMNNNPQVGWNDLLGPSYGQALTNASNNYLSSLYGYAVTGAPANGTPTLQGAQLGGMFQGNPTLPAQEASGTFGPDMGYLAGQPTLARGEALGNLGGANYTLADQQAYGFQGGPDRTGAPTLGMDTLNYNTALDAMRLLGSLQSNPFAMERVARGIDSTGIPNAVRGLMEGGAIPGFQAPQATPQQPGLASSLGLMSNWGSTDVPSGYHISEAAEAPVSWKAGDKIYTDPNGYGFVQQSTPTGANWLATGQKFGFAPSSFNAAVSDGSAQKSGPMPGGGQGAGPDSADPGSPFFDPARAAGIDINGTEAIAPAPNKLNAVNYLSGGSDLQDFINSLYSDLGYNPANIKNQLTKELPGFTAPRYGTVVA